jgi:hypothetical protein
MFKFLLLSKCWMRIPKVGITFGLCQRQLTILDEMCPDMLGFQDLILV